MQDKSLEAVSAMMDGEIEEFELRRVIERSGEDKALSDKWQRYHLAQDVMRGQAVDVAANTSFVSAISAAIDSEPTYNASAIAHSEQEIVVKAEPTQSQWWKPAASMAVAASVTAVVLLGSGVSFQDDSVPAFDLAGVPTGNAGFPQGKFGDNLATVSVNSGSANHGFSMGPYVQQHIELTSAKMSDWQASWLPNGYHQVGRNVNGQSQVLLYSNGTNDVSISIEPLSAQMVPQSVSTANKLLALAIRSNERFVTVVGPLSVDVASKIAASVEPKTTGQ